jgi:hypothetical protein
MEKQKTICRYQFGGRHKKSIVKKEKMGTEENTSGEKRENGRKVKH